MTQDPLQQNPVDRDKLLRLPYLTPGGTLVIPFDSNPKYHWWKGGQSIVQTRAEVLARMAVERTGPES